MFRKKQMLDDMRAAAAEPEEVTEPEDYTEDYTEEYTEDYTEGYTEDYTEEYIEPIQY